MGSILRRLILWIASLLPVVAALPVLAATPLESALPKPDNNVRARLVAETSAITPGSTFLVGLHFKIKDGWHTYWRFAGDSGAPTTIKWTLPDGFKASDIIWPMPIEVPLGPLMDYGYEHEVTHLVSITAPSNLVPGEIATLRASSEWLVCSDEVCIPQWGDYSLSLPVASAGEAARPDPVWGERITETVDQLPSAAPFEVTSSLDGDTLGLSLHNPQLAQRLKSGAVRAITYFPYEDGIVLHAEPQMLSTARAGVVLTAKASYLATSGRLPDPLHGLIVVTGKDGARQGYDISAQPGPTLAGATPFASSGQPKSVGQAGIGLAGAALFAFLGGLILNLMPCVFPVLSMKALAFAQHDRGDHKGLRAQGWFFTAGVMASFAALALTLLALRGGGAAIGWGYQLQSPIIVLLLAYLMFVIGLSLSGLLVFGSGLAGVGDTLTRLPGGIGAFFTGVLATIVATPCTAPFMSAAVGYALLAPASTGFVVFLALGAGLAAPFLVLSHMPRALAWLPKPGGWMERLKEFLAFPMFGAAAWLLWVLAQQIGASGLLAALAGFVLIAFAAWLLRVTSGGHRVWLGRAIAALAALCAVGVAAVSSQATIVKTPDKDVSQEGWSPYSEARLGDALKAGQPVFVDATAAWCLTCKVNELGVLSSRRVKDAFNSDNVLLLRADWTNRDDEITALLSRNGRLGVPLYLFYAKDSDGTAKILPQILTEDVVLAALGD